MAHGEGERKIMFGTVSFWFCRLRQRRGREAWCTVRAHVSTSIDMSINFHKQIRLNGQAQPNGGTYALFRAPGQIQGFSPPFQSFTLLSFLFLIRFPLFFLVSFFSNLIQPIYLLSSYIFIL